MDDDPLLGWGLRPVELADRALLEPFFASLHQPLSDFTFAQLYTWRNSLRILWMRIDHHLCVFANGSGDLTLLMPPIGDTRGDRALTVAFEMMDAYNTAKGVPHNSRVEYTSDELLSRFDRTRLSVQPLATDYLYDVRRMIDLPGGDLASKRQAKNRFLRLYEYQVEDYDPGQHLDECLQLLESWKQHQDQQHATDADISAVKRRKEMLATQLTLQYAAELNLRGMVVRVRDAAGRWPIKGFTFGEPLGADQSSIIVEKTDLEIKGLAQFIFSEFCRRYWADRPLVNVGDDWGLETLAWTKMSYRPVGQLQKYVLRRPVTAKVAIPATVVAPPAVISPVDVRPATRRDLAACVELEKACFTAYRLSRRQLQYLMTRPSVSFLAAVEGERLVGQGIALVRQHRRGLSGRIYSLAVDANCRGRKIGRKLLEAMIADLARRGVGRIYLEVEKSNAAAIALYEHCGFRYIGLLPNYYGSGVDGLHMMCEAAVPAAV